MWHKVVVIFVFLLSLCNAAVDDSLVSKIIENNNNNKLNNTLQYFNKGVKDYETALTEEDFARAKLQPRSRMADQKSSPQEYNKDKFEGLLFNIE
jgi:hypothetical protein